MIEVIRKLMLQVHLHFAQVAVAAVDLRGQMVWLVIAAARPPRP